MFCVYPCSCDIDAIMSCFCFYALHATVGTADSDLRDGIGSAARTGQAAGMYLDQWGVLYNIGSFVVVL